MVNNDPNHRNGTANSGNGAKRWLPWVIGALLLLGLILLLRSCGDDEAATVSEDPAATIDSSTVGGTVGNGTAGTNQTINWSAGDFGIYLSGNEPLGRSFALERVTFASGSALLNADARAQIGEVAAALKSRPTARVELRGYADPEGDAAANQALSEQRTQAVRNALTDAGAQASQVTAATALGETGNAATSENRRVEITVTAR